MAAIVLQAGRERSTHIELIEFCEPRLPYFAVPRFIEFVDELPTTENGKVQKYKLRERGVTARTWDREAAGTGKRRPGFGLGNGGTVGSRGGQDRFRV